MTAVARYRGAAEPFIYTKRTVWMQRVVDVVRAGAPHFITGKTPIDRVPSMLDKFGKRYVLNASRGIDSRARKSGEHVARWIGYTLEDDPERIVYWVLFYWPAKDGACKEEKWQTLPGDRIKHAGYELVRHTRAGAKAPAWTWRYTKDRYQQLRDDAVLAIRRRQDAIVRQIIHTLSRSPGFAGVREQVKAVYKLLRAEWKRSRGSETAPEIPTRIGYVRRLPDVGKLLSELAPKNPPKKRSLRSNAVGV
jgi:hypothetical protein